VERKESRKERREGHAEGGPKLKWARGGAAGEEGGTKEGEGREVLALMTLINRKKKQG